MGAAGTCSTEQAAALTPQALRRRPKAHPLIRKEGAAIPGIPVQKTVPLVAAFGALSIAPQQVGLAALFMFLH